MAPKNDYWIIYVSVFVPLVIVVTGIVLALTLGKPENSTPAAPTEACASNEDCQHGGACDMTTKRCVCPSQYVGNRCQTLYVAPTLTVQNCGASPKECTEDVDCAACQSTEAYTCQQLTPEENAAGLDGKYCLPAKPSDNCGMDVCKDIGDAAGRVECYSKRIPGSYYWEGWSGVDTQAWSCSCDFPLYYRAEIGTEDAGACKKTPELCKYGKWIYPCKTNPDAPDVCLPMSPEEEQELVGSQPLYNGKCDCQNVPCTTNTDCASNVCKDGVCQYQRTALDPQTGLPTCVLDTCKPHGDWVGQKEPPYAYGRCICSGGAIDTGYSCYMPPPPIQQTLPCPQNCSSHGFCLVDGTCACNEGYTGEACDQFKCDDGCVNRGSCIGYNQCTCQPNTVYAGLKADGSPNCLPQIACYPKPTVDPATGKISNPSSFPNADSTACLYGTVDEFTKLCQSSDCSMTMDGSIPVNCKEGSKFDGYRSGKCFKNVDCSTTVCKDQLMCGPSVLPDYVEPKVVYKVPVNSTTCGNPTLDQVKALCMHNPTPRPEGSTAQYVFTQEYKCVDAQPQYNIVLDKLSALSGAGITGSLCIPNLTAAQKESDGNGIIGVWRLWLTGGVDQPVDATSNAYAGGLLQMQVRVPDSTSPCADSPGYFYAFEASFTGTLAASLPPNTPVYFAVFGIPLNKWTCPKGETNIMNCVSIYYTKSELTIPCLELTLQYDPNALLYSSSILPTFQPCVAYQLTQNAYPGMSSWTKDMLATVQQSSSGSAVVSSSSAEYLAVAPPPECDQALVKNQSDLFVQVACMDTYCQSFGGGAGSKLVVIAWNYVANTASIDKSTSCTNLDTILYAAVKYRLTRQYSTDGPQTLIGPSSPLYITSDAKYAYYVDVLPVQPQPWTYTLVSYVARSAADTITTYDVSPCKSRPVKVTIMIEPYSESFCQSLPPPDRTRTSPAMMWLNHTTGMCEWMDSQANQAAGDYDCALRRGAFEPTALSLVNSNGQCATLQPSYPVLDPSFKWLTPTCDPGSSYDKSVCLTGVNQMRAASCSESLLMQGGKIVDSTQFSERISNLYKFYDMHYPTDKTEDVQAALGNPTELYKKYYHCGMDPADPGYDSQWGTVGPCKDPSDTGCTEALKTATRTLANGVVQQVCGVTNKCYSWEDVSMAGSTTKTFQQRRQCFPSADYETSGSPCCSYHGTYDIDLDKLKGTCTCTAETSYRGDQCQTDLCLTSDNKPIDCGGHGTCGYDKTSKRVKCNCEAGYYNRKVKNPRDTFPAEPDDFLCTKNRCPNYMDDFYEYKDTPWIGTDKTPCGSHPFKYDDSTNSTTAAPLRNGGAFASMTYPTGAKGELQPVANVYTPGYTNFGGGTTSPKKQYDYYSINNWTQSGQCNEETGLCMCGDKFGVTNDNMCVSTDPTTMPAASVNTSTWKTNPIVNWGHACHVQDKDKNVYGWMVQNPPGVSAGDWCFIYDPPGAGNKPYMDSYGDYKEYKIGSSGSSYVDFRNNEQMNPAYNGKQAQAQANGRYGDWVWKYKASGYMCDAATKACKYVESGKVDDFKFPTMGDCNCAVIDAGSRALAPAEHPTGVWGAGAVVMVPIGAPFTATKPFVQLRALSTGTVYVTGGDGSDLASARYVLRGFGNTVANQMDADSSNPVVLWGKETSGGRSSTSTPQPGYIPGFGSGEGNARVEVGKTYQLYIRIWDQTNDTINLSWPAFTITQTDNLGYQLYGVASSVTNYVSSMTYTPNTPPLLINNYWVKAAPQLGSMYSPDGKYKVWVNPVNGILQLVAPNGGYSNISPSAADVTSLYLDKNGVLHLYDMNFNEKWRSPDVVSSTATVPPFTAQLTNEGYFQVMDKNGISAWRYNPWGPLYFPRPATPETFVFDDNRLAAGTSNARDRYNTSYYFNIGEFGAYGTKASVDSGYWMETGDGEDNDVAFVTIVLVDIDKFNTVCSKWPGNYITGGEYVSETANTMNTSGSMYKALNTTGVVVAGWKLTSGYTGSSSVAGGRGEYWRPNYPSGFTYTDSGKQYGYGPGENFWAVGRDYEVAVKLKTSNTVVIPGHRYGVLVWMGLGIDDTVRWFPLAQNSTKVSNSGSNQTSSAQYVSLAA